MKTPLRWFNIAFVAFFSTLVARGGTFTNLDSFGSSGKAEAVGLENLAFQWISVYQFTDNGYVDVKNRVLETNRFSTKLELDTFFRDKIRFVAEGALTNTLVDKDKPFFIWAYAGKYSPELRGIVKYFELESSFPLIKQEDGSYRLPEFSNLRVPLPRQLLVRVPGMLWARMEVYRKGASSTGPIDYNDSRIDTGSDNLIISTDGDYPYLIASSEYATDTEHFVLKVIMAVRENGKVVFKVFGPDGYLTKNTDFTISNFQAVGEGVSFDISGGDTGRVFVIERASDLAGPWTADENQFVVRPYGASSHFERLTTGCGSAGFYRIRTLDVVPY